MPAAAAIDWERYPALAASRALSRRLVEGLADDLRRLTGPDAPVFIAAAGSLARLEAHAASDCDLLLAAPGAVADELRAHIDAAIAGQGLRAAKAEGIYTGTLQREVLLDPARRGSLSEPPGDFGRRMALLLDAAPLSNEPEFRRWQRDVLDWYTAAPDGDRWQLLIDDLGRYRQAYRSWQRFDRALPHWALRQVKLQGSRTLGYAGLLVLVLQAGAQGEDGRAWLADQLDRTPLERVVDAMQRADIDSAAMLEAYAAIHEMLCDPSARQALSGDPESAAARQLLAEARVHGQRVRGELLRLFEALAASAALPAAGSALF